MATIAGTRSSPAWGTEKIFYEQINQDDESAVFRPGGKLQKGTIQATGTFTTATLDLQGSNDGTNFVTVDDIGGTTAQLSAAGFIEFQTTFLEYKLVGGGTTLDADVTVILRDTV